MVQIDNLVKKYNKVLAVDGISIDIDEGTFVSLLGPNGAGKTTTINILCTLLEKTSGKVFIDGLEIGKNNDDIRKVIGVVFQESILDGELSVKENLMLRSSFYGIDKKEAKKRIDEISSDIDINNILDRRYKALSGGQKRRVDIARALINLPKLLILDEPTAGLDPQSRKTVWKIIKNLQIKRNLSVILTTHYMEESLNSDKIIIINDGKIVTEGTPQDLRVRYSRDLLKILPNDNMKFKNVLDSIDFEYKIDNDVYVIEVKTSMDALEIINKFKENIRDFEVIRGTMDDVFINLTSNNERND